MKSMVMVWTCDDDQAPDLENKREKTQNGLKAKVYLIGSFCFGDQDT
jgi:hypothetical protein